MGASWLPFSLERCAILHSERVDTLCATFLITQILTPLFINVNPRLSVYVSTAYGMDWVNGREGGSCTGFQSHLSNEGSVDLRHI